MSLQMWIQNYFHRSFPEEPFAPVDGVRRNPLAVVENLIRVGVVFLLYPSILSADRSLFARDAGRLPLRLDGPRLSDRLAGRLPAAVITPQVSLLFHSYERFYLHPVSRLRGRDFVPESVSPKL
jgi:hypothetical protein